jgi:nucleoside-diphosphate-sugar epimerase
MYLKATTNMKKTILITGSTGFIGSHVLSSLVDKYDLTALIRPNRDISKLPVNIAIQYINLSETEKLNDFLETHFFDVICHIGALRGGRSASKADFIKTNLTATEHLVDSAIKNKSKLIFCSSVGVYGTIPSELPATLSTPYSEDNLYHSTKIQSERLILDAVKNSGLEACIVRPAITYGSGDFGFPYTLTKLVDQHKLFLPHSDIYIHMTNVDTIVETFDKLIENSFNTGSIYNVADNDHVCFRELVDFIYQKLHDKSKYPKNRYINSKFFCLGKNAAKLIKNELWTSRFELLSSSWYFDVAPVYADLNLTPSQTIPNYEKVIEFYQESKTYGRHL